MSVLVVGADRRVVRASVDDPAVSRLVRRLGASVTVGPLLLLHRPDADNPNPLATALLRRLSGETVWLRGQVVLTGEAGAGLPIGAVRLLSTHLQVLAAHPRQLQQMEAAARVSAGWRRTVACDPALTDHEGSQP